MAETIVLPAPKPAITEYELRSLFMELGDPEEANEPPDPPPVEYRRSVIRLIYVANTGEDTRTVEYVGAKARAYIMALGKANLSTKNLWRRINEAVLADGRWAEANSTPGGAL